MQLKQLSNRDYHADPAIGSTSVRSFLSNPVKFLHDREHGIKLKVNEGIRIGSAVHSMTSNTFNDECVVMPEFNLKSPSDRSKAEMFKMQHREFTCLSTSEYETAQNMFTALTKSPHHRYFTEGTQEEAMFWKDDSTGMDLKVKWDGRGDRVVEELKCLSPLDFPYEKSWARTMYDWGYDVQFALYSHALSLYEKVKIERIKHRVVIVESSPPHLVHCFITPPEWIELGMRRLRRTLHEMKDAFEWGLRVPSLLTPSPIPPPEQWMMKGYYE